MIDTAKPRPSLPPDFEMFWLTMPMTSPAMLKMGPPEFPVSPARSTPGTSTHARSLGAAAPGVLLAYDRAAAQNGTESAADYGAAV